MTLPSDPFLPTNRMESPLGLTGVIETLHHTKQPGACVGDFGGQSHTGDLIATCGLGKDRPRPLGCDRLGIPFQSRLPVECRLDAHTAN